MLSGIFDSHAHYDDEAFEEDRDSLLQSLFENGVSFIINCASDLSTSLSGLELAERYDGVYAAAGIHPHEALAAGPCDLEKTAELLARPKCVAVGEIGLDYHYDFSPRDLQLSFFEQQLAAAKEHGVPVIVHDREAHEDTLRLLKKYRPAGVVHCFSGSAEMAKEVLRTGMYIGLGGAVTFKNARKSVEVAQTVPGDRLLIETDCPYMTPVPHRGKRNDSSFIPFTAEVLAGIRGTDAQSIIDLTRENAKRLFGI